MRLSKEEFVEIWNQYQEARKKDNKMQDAIGILCEDSYPVLSQCYHEVLLNLLETITDSESCVDIFLGESKRGWIGDKEYDLTNPESAYDWIRQSLDAQKSQRNTHK